MELNPNIEVRDKLIFSRYRPNKYKFGASYFQGLSAKTLETLITQHYIDPAARHNASPTAEEILTFLQQYPAYTAHGYTVSATNGQGVIIQGVEKGVPQNSVEEFQDYMILFHDADEINTTTMYCLFK